MTMTDLEVQFAAQNPVPAVVAPKWAGRLCDQLQHLQPGDACGCQGDASDQDRNPSAHHGTSIDSASVVPQAETSHVAVLDRPRKDEGYGRIQVVGRANRPDFRRDPEVRLSAARVEARTARTAAFVVG